MAAALAWFGFDEQDRIVGVVINDDGKQTLAKAAKWLHPVARIETITTEADRKARFAEYVTQLDAEIAAKKAGA